MDNNTLISHELEDMRKQIGILKRKLDEQAIVNEQHIRNSMKSKMTDISKTVTVTLFLGLFALVYCTWFFYTQGCSLVFTVATFVMLAICLVLTIMQRTILGNIDLAQGNLIENAQKLTKVKIHYQDWHKVAIPMLVLWFGWLMYEMVGLLDMSTPMAAGFCCGAAVGGIIGGIIGFRINRKIVRKANEILDQIEELRKG